MQCTFTACSLGSGTPFIWGVQEHANKTGHSAGLSGQIMGFRQRWQTTSSQMWRMKTCSGEDFTTQQTTYIVSHFLPFVAWKQVPDQGLSLALNLSRVLHRNWSAVLSNSLRIIYGNVFNMRGVFWARPLSSSQTAGVWPRCGRECCSSKDLLLTNTSWTSNYFTRQEQQPVTRLPPSRSSEAHPANTNASIVAPTGEITQMKWWLAFL